MRKKLRITELQKAELADDLMDAAIEISIAFTLIHFVILLPAVIVTNTISGQAYTWKEIFIGLAMLTVPVLLFELVQDDIRERIFARFGENHSETYFQGCLLLILALVLTVSHFAIRSTTDSSLFIGLSPSIFHLGKAIFTEPKLAWICCCTQASVGVFVLVAIDSLLRKSNMEARKHKATADI